MDYLHVVNEVIEKSAEYTNHLYMACIEYEKAFGSVLTAEVLEALKHQGIGETYIRLLEYVYREFTGRITLHKQTDKFLTLKEVTQGYTMSPKLFTASLEWVFRKLDW